MMVEWEVRIFFPDNSFGQVLDDNRFSPIWKERIFFHASLLAPSLFKSTVPKNTAVYYFRINSNLSRESMIKGEVKQDFAVVRIQVVPHV